MTHIKSPAFWAGLAIGLIGGLWLIELGFEQTRDSRPPFAAISAEP